MEDYSEFFDYLCFKRDNDIKKMIKDEELLFSDKITRLGTIDWDRYIVITNKALYYLKNKGK